MTLSEYLKQVKERCEAATEGPWELTDLPPALERPGIKAVSLKGPYSDAAFIANARTDVPVLLEMVDTFVRRLDTAALLLKETHYAEYTSIMSCIDRIESLVPANRKIEKIKQAILDMDGKETRNTEEI